MGADAVFFGQKILRIGNLKKLDYWSEPEFPEFSFKIQRKEEKGGGRVCESASCIAMWSLQTQTSCNTMACRV
jgi:hypothetical protein